MSNGTASFFKIIAFIDFICGFLAGILVGDNTVVMVIIWVGSFLNGIIYYEISTILLQLDDINDDISEIRIKYSNDKYDSATFEIPPKDDFSQDENTPVHQWRCNSCGRMISVTPCPYCQSGNIILKKPSNVPYWCGKCGKDGPYEGNCPDCGSSVKLYNV